MFGGPHGLGHRRRRRQFMPMPLTVIEGQAVQRLESLVPGDGQTGGAVDPAAAEDDCRQPFAIHRRELYQLIAFGGETWQRRPHTTKRRSRPGRLSSGWV